MFIQTEQTPNPSTLKFLPGRVVMEKGTMDFATADTAAPSPLAKRLFAVEGVERVFLGSDFVTVTKSADRDWQVLKRRGRKCKEEGINIISITVVDFYLTLNLQ